jgi:hypothetical protein
VLCLNRLCYRCLKTVLITRNVETSIYLPKYLLLPHIVSRNIKRPKKTCKITMKAFYLLQATKMQKRSSGFREFRVYTDSHLFWAKVHPLLKRSTTFLVPSFLRFKFIKSVYTRSYTPVIVQVVRKSKWAISASD